MDAWMDYGQVEIPGFWSRRVRVHLPEGFHASRLKSALVLFDGQNVFGDEGSFAGGLWAHEAVKHLRPDRHNVPLIVAVDNSGERFAELAPWQMRGMGGRAEPFVHWIADQLLPRVRDEFALTEGALGAVVGGSSLGGLAALYAHFLRPDAFGAALCMSPSFFAGALLPFLEGRDNPAFSRIYIDCGVAEVGGRMLAMGERVIDLLRRRGYDDSTLRWQVDPNGTHNELHWRRRLPGALDFLFRA